MITLDFIEIDRPEVDKDTIAEAAAYLAAAGIDAIAYLRSGDDVERGLMIEAASRVYEIKAIERHNLAVEIANKVAEVF